MAAIPNCIICYEPFPDWNALSALACGHIFHYKCITDWAQQCEEKESSSTCPACLTRFEVSEARGIVRRLYFTFEDEAEVARRTRELSELQFKLTLTETMLKSANEQLEVVQKRETDRLETQDAKRQQKERALQKRLEEWKKDREEALLRKEKQREKSESSVADYGEESTSAFADPPSLRLGCADSTSHVVVKPRAKGLVLSRDYDVEENGGDSLDGAIGGVALSISRSSPDSTGSSRFSSCFSSPVTPSDATPLSLKASPLETESAFKPYGFTTPTSPKFCFASLAANPSSISGATPSATMAPTPSATMAPTPSATTATASPIFASALSCFRFSAPTDDVKTGPSAPGGKKTISSENALFAFGKKPPDGIFSSSNETLAKPRDLIEGASGIDDSLKVRTWPMLVSTTTAITHFQTAISSSSPFAKKRHAVTKTGVRRLTTTTSTTTTFSVTNSFGICQSGSATPKAATFPNNPDTISVGAFTPNASRPSSVPLDSRLEPFPAPSSFTPPPGLNPVSTSVAGMFTVPTSAAAKSVSHSSGRGILGMPMSISTTSVRSKPAFTPFLSTSPIFVSAISTTAHVATSTNPLSTSTPTTSVPMPNFTIASLATISSTTATSSMSSSSAFDASLTTISWSNPALKSVICSFPSATALTAISTSIAGVSASPTTASYATATGAANSTTSASTNQPQPTSSNFVPFPSTRSPPTSSSSPSCLSLRPPTLVTSLKPTTLAAPTPSSSSSSSVVFSFSTSSATPFSVVPFSQPTASSSIFSFPPVSNAQDFWMPTSTKPFFSEESSRDQMGASRKSSNTRRIRKGRTRCGPNFGISLPSINFNFDEAIKSPVASIEGENLDGDDGDPYERDDDDDAVHQTGDASGSSADSSIDAVVIRKASGGSDE